MKWEEEQAAQRSTKQPVGTWHSCSRFWQISYECPFHGKRPRRRREEDEEQGPEEEIFEDPVKTGIPVGARKEAPTPRSDSYNELVPVTTERRTDKVLQAQAEVAYKIPAPHDEVIPARGVPMYIPDEQIPQWEPPGLEGALNNISGIAEARFAALLSSLASGVARPAYAAASGTETLVDEEVSAVGRPIPAPSVPESGFEQYGWLALTFYGAVTASAIAHVWRFYNARIPPAPQPYGRLPNTTRPTPPSAPAKAPNVNRAPAKPSAVGKQVPTKAPRPPYTPRPQVPVGGGGAGYVKQAPTFRPEGPLIFKPTEAEPVVKTPEEFDEQWDDAIADFPEYVSEWYESDDNSADPAFQAF